MCISIQKQEIQDFEHLASSLAHVPLIVGLSCPLYESVSGRSKNVPLGGGLDRLILTQLLTFNILWHADISLCPVPMKSQLTVPD